MPGATRLTLDLARDAIRARLPRGGRAVVGVTGPVGAGKSSLAASLAACVISTDDYLPDYDRVPEAERDEPRHADLARLAENLRDLRAGRSTAAPVWSFHTHARTGERRIHPPSDGLIVVEGLHALHGPVASLLDLAIVVDAHPLVRWARWAHLESIGVRGWGVEKARAFFDAVAEPTFARFRPALLDRADLVVLNDRGIPGAPPDNAGRANLAIVHGPMFAGKTSELHRRIATARAAQRDVRVFKPARDTRYDAAGLTTHTGESVPATPIAHAAEAFANAAPGTLVVIDEAHFFGDTLVAPTRDALARGIRILLAGVSLDHRGRPFEPFASLLAQAAEVLTLRAPCAACGQPGVHSHRKHPVEGRIVVGGADLYEARCEACFRPGP